MRTLVVHALRSSLRAPWLRLDAALFVALNVLVAFAGIAGTSALGTVGFGPTAAGLVDLNLVVVPLMTLVAGALGPARDRERGTTALLLAQPVGPRRLFLATFAGTAIALTGVIALGFAAASAVVLAAGGGGDANAIAGFAGETWLLALATLALGMLLSVLAGRAPLALGAAVAAWFVLVAGGDLGVMAGALATHLGTQGLLAAALANPLEAYRIAAIAAISGSVDVLGPGGRLAADTFGVWLMPLLSFLLVLWAALALLAADCTVRYRDAV